MYVTIRVCVDYSQKNDLQNGHVTKVLFYLFDLPSEEALYGRTYRAEVGQLSFDTLFRQRGLCCKFGNSMDGIRINR